MFEIINDYKNSDDKQRMFYYHLNIELHEIYIYNYVLPIQL